MVTRAMVMCLAMWCNFWGFEEKVLFLIRNIDVVCFHVVDPSLMDQSMLGETM